MKTISNLHTQRFVQFELLRIVAMIFVVLNHVIGYGLGIFEFFSVDTSIYSGFFIWSLLQLLKLIPSVGVNLFVLITGYFTIERKQLRLRGIWRVWSTVWLYSVSIYIIFAVIGTVPFSWHNLLREATPLLSNTYWFVTSYIILMLLAPFISRMLAHATNFHYIITIILGGIICFQPFLGQYVMDSKMIILFVYLFIIGGYIRKFHKDLRIKDSYILLFIATILFLMFLYVLYKNASTGSNNYKIFSMTYYGLVLPLSVGVFLYAKNWNIKNKRIKKIILIVAPLSFSVYIIESHSVVHTLLYDYLNNIFLSLNILLVPLACIASTIIIYMVCIFIDFLKLTIKDNLWPIKE